MSVKNREKAAQAWCHETTSKIVMDPVLCAEFERILDNAELDLMREIEQIRLQLAACGVAAMCNTEESIDKQRIHKDSPYYTATYQDICNGIDRGMELRAKLAIAIEALEIYAHHHTWYNEGLNGNLWRCDPEPEFEITYDANSAPGRMAQEALEAINGK